MHLVQKITVRTSTKHNEAQHVSLQISMTNTQRRHISPHWTATTSTVKMTKWETVTLLTRQAHHSVQLYLQQLMTTQTHNNFPEGSQNNTYTQSVKLDSPPNSEPTIVDWKPNSSRNLYDPFRQAISHYSLSKVKLLLKNNTLHRSIMDSTLHPLSLQWIPGLFLYTLPHAVVWQSASQCFRISGMTLRKARPLSTYTARLTNDRDRFMAGGWPLSWWWVWTFCSLTVYLWACPLSSGLFVGGADGVSDCREGLEQRVKETEI